MHVDAFGNLATNLERQHIPAGSRLTIKIGGVQIDRLVATFGDGEADQLIALFDSAGKLSICVVNGSAADRLKAGIGDSSGSSLINNSATIDSGQLHFKTNRFSIQRMNNANPNVIIKYSKATMLYVSKNLNVEAE